MRGESEFKNERSNSELAKRLRHRGMRRLRPVARRSIAVLALVTTFCASGFLYGQNQKKKQKDADNSFTASSLLPDSQAIDLLVSQMLGTWQARDVEAMHKFYADDIMVISGGWEPPLMGWANYAQAYQTQMARTSTPRLERTNSYIKVLGDAAWVTYQWQFSGNVDGQALRAFGHTTLLLQKRSGNWLIVLNHTSAIPTEEPSAGAPATPANGQPTSALTPGRK